MFRFGSGWGFNSGGALAAVRISAVSGNGYLLLRGTNGAVVYADWGDGSAIATITLLGTSTDVVTEHSFSASANVRLFGKTCEITRLVGYATGKNALQRLRLASVSALCKLEYLKINYAAGDLSALSALPLTYLWIYYADNQVTGNISVFTGKAMTVLVIGYADAATWCSISGHLSALAAITSLTLLILRGGSVGGYIGDSLYNRAMTVLTIRHSSGSLLWRAGAGVITTSWAVGITIQFNDSTELRAPACALMLDDLSKDSWTGATVDVRGTNDGLCRDSDLDGQIEGVVAAIEAAGMTVTSDGV